MSAEYDVLLKGSAALEYLDKLATGAEHAHKAILGMQNAAAAGVKLRGSGAGASSGIWGGAGRSGGSADPWARQWKAAERAQSNIWRDEQRFSAYRIRLDRKEGREKELSARRVTAVAEREAAKQRREDLKNSALNIRVARREASEKARAAKAAAAGVEKAAHKPWFGGHKSVGDLLTARKNDKIKGIATGAADAVINAPSSILGGALDLVGWTAAAAYNLGKAAVSAQAMREESVEGFRAIYGTAVDSEKLFDNARTAAKQTKLDTADVVKIYNTEAASGFSAQQLDPIFWNVADVSSARGNQKGQQYLRGLGKLNAQDNAMFGTFQQAAMAGPGLKNAEEALADKLGLTDRKNLDAKLRHMFRGHEVKGQTALAAITGATTSLYDKKTGQAGEYAKAQGSTSWAGIISNIKNGMGDILNMRLPAGNAINQFKKILEKIGGDGGLFDSRSAVGKRFERLIGAFIDDIFMPFGGKALSGTDNVLSRILDAGEALEKQFKRVMEDITKGVDNFFGSAKGSIMGLAEDIGFAIAHGMKRAAQEALPEPIGHPVGVWQKLFDGNEWSKPENWNNNLGDAYRYLKGDDAPKQSLAGGGRVRGDYFGQPVMIEAHAGEIVSGLDGEFLPSGRGSLAGMQFSSGGGAGGGGPLIGSIELTLPIMSSGASAAEIIAEASVSLAAVVRSELSTALGLQHATGGL